MLLRYDASHSTPWLAETIADPIERLTLWHEFKQVSSPIYLQSLMDVIQSILQFEPSDRPSVDEAHALFMSLSLSLSARTITATTAPSSSPLMPSPSVVALLTWIDWVRLASHARARDSE